MDWVITSIGRSIGFALLTVIVILFLVLSLYKVAKAKAKKRDSNKELISKQR